MLEQPDVVAELGSGGREAGEGGQDEGVLLARVRLAGDQEAVREARLLGHEAVEALGLLGVAVEERHERRLRAGRPLAAQKAQLVRAADELAVVEGEVLEPQARALADRRGLRGLEMREAEAGKVAISAREPREAAHDAHRARREKAQRRAQEEEVGVVANEGRGRPEVQDPARGRSDVAEGVQVRHDVVLRLAFVPVGGDELGLGRHEVGAERVERGLGDREPELLFCFGEPEPEVAPRRELRPRREQSGHLGGRVSARERVFVTVDGGVAQGAHSSISSSDGSRNSFTSSFPQMLAKRARDALLLVVLEEIARRVTVETDDEVDFLAHGAILQAFRLASLWRLEPPHRDPP